MFFFPLFIEKIGIIILQQIKDFFLFEEFFLLFFEKLAMKNFN